MIAVRISVIRFDRVQRRRRRGRQRGRTDCSSRGVPLGRLDLRAQISERDGEFVVDLLHGIAVSWRNEQV